MARGFVLPLGGQVTSQILAAGGAFFAATSTGTIVAFDNDGIMRWQVDVGQLSNACPQLAGYGVTGTGVIDQATSTLYVADAFGRLHALSLATGAERPGWPVHLFSDDRQELDWGALTLADGSVYVPTAAYCDAANTPGAVYRVDTSTRTVTQWLAVPLSLGGGGGPWGWGGLAFDPAQNTLFAATSGAFAGGSNTGSSFSEFVGYGDQLVQFAPDLTVDTSSHPADLPNRDDLDFVGSPLVVSRPGCGPLVLAADKDDTVYAWRENAVAAGPVAEIPLQAYNSTDPMLTELAWSPALDSLYVTTGTQLVRIAIAADCSATIVWQEPLGTHTENGSPTVSVNTVWFAVNGPAALVAYNATTGQRVFQTQLGGTTVTAPAIVDNRLVIGTLTGLVEGFTFGANRTLASAGTHAAAAGVTAVSWAGQKDGWESRENGVYATDDGGRSWREIYAEPALAIARLSESVGVIDLGVDPGPCMCTTHKLWTNDGGLTWHETDRIGDAFTGSGGTLYWWAGGFVYAVAGFPPNGDRPLETTRLADLSDGTIVDGAPLDGGGIAALVSNRVDGHGWDVSPRVIVVRGSEVSTSTLPPAAQGGQILAEQIAADGPELTVTATNFATDPASQVTWTSEDAGATWSLNPA